jgi:hypothetical protein
MSDFIISDLDSLRERLFKMTDKELREYGRSANTRCRPENRRTEPLSPFEMLMPEIRAEWQRRHPDRPRRKMPLFT